MNVKIKNKKLFLYVTIVCFIFIFIFCKRFRKIQAHFSCKNHDCVNTFEENLILFKRTSDRR